MSASKYDQIMRDARGLLVRLRAEGRNRDAEILHRLIVSRATSSGTNKSLHADLLEARRDLEKIRVLLARRPADAPAD